MWPRVLEAALGVWLMISPAVLGSGSVAASHQRIVGPVVAAVAIVAMAEVVRSLLRMNAALGCWLVVAPFVLGFAPLVMANSIVVGVLLIVLAGIRGPRRNRYGGGWAALRRRSVSSGDDR
jgi:SPW repeat-containing protein